MVSNIIGLILAIFKAFPVIEKWFDQIQEARRIAKNKKSIEESMEKDDQRPVEKAMGSTNVGGHSTIPGSEVVDSLPGVKK